MESNNTEWMDATQSKERFGLGFKRLLALANEGVIDFRKLPPDEDGNVTYLFRVDSVRDYIENVHE